MKLIQKKRCDALVEITREMMMANVSRRAMLAAGGFAAITTAAHAAGVFGNPDLPSEGAVNVTNPKALTDPGPQDSGLRSILRPNEFRTGAGHGRSPRMTSKSRRRSRALTCASAREAFASFTGTNRPSGQS